MGRVSLISCIRRYIKGLQPINVTVQNNILDSGKLLEGKVAVVTGASRGIGLAIARQFIAQGARVIGIAKHTQTLDEATSELGTEHFKAITFDLTLFNEYDVLMAKILSHCPSGNIDILVNCAGLKNGQEAEYWKFTSEQFDECIAVNSKAPFFLSRKVSKNMIDHNIKGRIINIIGIKGYIGEPSPYSMSKFALMSLTKGMARMMAPRGIIVNGIAPGATNTAGRDNLFLTDTTTGRFGTPEEIANIALFLASDLCSNMIGSIITCDGGEMLQYRNNRY